MLFGSSCTRCFNEMTFLMKIPRAVQWTKHRAAWCTHAVVKFLQTVKWHFVFLILYEAFQKIMTVTFARENSVKRKGIPEFSKPLTSAIFTLHRVFYCVAPTRVVIGCQRLWRFLWMNLRLSRCKLRLSRDALVKGLQSLIIVTPFALQSKKAVSIKHNTYFIKRPISC